MNTADPGTSLSCRTPGKSFGIELTLGHGHVSGGVDEPFELGAFVTGVRSIQNPPTETRWAGSASGIPQPWHPIQNVPPAIHPMFAGAAARGDQQPAMAIGTTIKRIQAAVRTSLDALENRLEACIAISVENMGQEYRA